MQDSNITKKKSWPIVVGVLVFVLAIGLAAAFAWYYYAIMLPAQLAKQEEVTINHMQAIARAMLAYYDTHDHFPPAFTPDAKRRPLTSWRVSLLPFLEEEALAQQYDDQQPWDSPANRKHAETTPKPFQGPLADCLPGQTPFCVVVGPDTMFTGNKIKGQLVPTFYDPYTNKPQPPVRLQGTQYEDCLDGTVNTLLFYADLEHPVTWSEPTDVSPETFIARYSKQDLQQKRLYVAFVSGDVVRITKIDPQNILNLLNRHDGESVEYEKIDLQEDPLAIPTN
ncbi:DUF1559 domain-containing protein [Bremerella cremea]|uniref:DUF1559 domain-containing protein n=1 Tax=Bremerella cremea TaxID=1031537 RepID=A0A368KJC2_9BACT|nr:DUF1559 domain-containing protein [Bremerella cremea]RCS40673.1 DUF1559 domain-containing protein [Bremerella cremea]